MTIHITGNLIVDDLVDNQEYIQLGGGKTPVADIEIEGDVRVRGTFRPWCPIIVEGDVIVRGGAE